MHASHCAVASVRTAATNPPTLILAATTALHDLLCVAVLPHCSPSRHHCNTTLRYASAPLYALRPLYHSTAMHPCATPRHHDALYYMLCSTALHTALHYWSTPLHHSTVPLRVHCSVHCIMAPLHHWCTPLHALLRCDALHHCTTATSSLHY